MAGTALVMRGNNQLVQNTTLAKFAQRAKNVKLAFGI
jgi:hypothetical protein